MLGANSSLYFKQGRNQQFSLGGAKEKKKLQIKSQDQSRTIFLYPWWIRLMIELKFYEIIEHK